MLSSCDLSDQFKDGVYSDYTLNEYEACRFFIKQLQPKTIKCIGGYTNMDLFYSCQDLENPVNAWNWDPCGFNERSLIDKKHEDYKALTDFNGNYHWMPRSIGGIIEIGDTPDLLWLNALQHEAIQVENLQSVIIVHYGSPFIIGGLVQLMKKIPIRAMGRRLAILSKTNIDMAKGPFPAIKQQFLFQENVAEIQR